MISPDIHVLQAYLAMSLEIQIACVTSTMLNVILPLYLNIYIYLRNEKKWKNAIPKK